MLSDQPAVDAKLSQDYGILASGLESFDTTLFYTDVGELTEAQEKGLLEYIRAGGGFFGLHTADASFRANKGYHAMLNGFFDGHSPYMDFCVEILDPVHPITRQLADFQVTDELHYLAHDTSRSQALMQAYDPTTHKTHVMAYLHSYGKGRVFYFALGHDQAVMQHVSVQTVVRRGTQWTAKQD